ncbi:HNH endonuclease [Halomonas sp. MS1]|nr:HNH endonuclease signature motif containing protein [Halomonas sp. MS1]UTD55478.1 HNH endonuclease [Halomonas sp. MS1]
MAKANKRKQISAFRVRTAWQSNIQAARNAGFCEYVIEAIEDDHDGLRLCWCCGARGYQEVAHIVPHSLGGRSTPTNLFLLCNECHVQSPDFLDPKAFIQFVNGNSGKASEALNDVLRYGVEQIKTLASEDPAKAESIFQNFGPRLDAALKESGAMTSAHGANVSLSTQMARIVYAINSALK